MSHLCPTDCQHADERAERAEESLRLMTEWKDRMAQNFVRADAGWMKCTEMRLLLQAAFLRLLKEMDVVPIMDEVNSRPNVLAAFVASQQAISAHSK